MPTSEISPTTKLEFKLTKQDKEMAQLIADNHFISDKRHRLCNNEIYCRVKGITFLKTTKSGKRFNSGNARISQLNNTRNLDGSYPFRDYVNSLIAEKVPENIMGFNQRAAVLTDLVNENKENRPDVAIKCIQELNKMFEPVDEKISITVHKSDKSEGSVTDAVMALLADKHKKEEENIVEGEIINE